MTATLVKDGAQTGWLKIHVHGNATAGGANALGSILNPEGVELQILDCYLYTTVAAADAATLDIGIHDAEDHDDTDMCAALAINAAAPNVKRICGGNVASEAALTGAQNGVKWGATEYLVFYNPAAQISTAFRANLFVEYLRLA
jgi:hypothetical protein